MFNKCTKNILFTKEQIKDKVKELGKKISEDFKNSKELVLVCVLKGAVPFLVDLSRQITVDHSYDFMVVSSYHGGIKSNKNPKIVLDLNTDIRDKDVLLIEDIVDTGRTLQKIQELLKSRKPNMLRTAIAFNKVDAIEVEVEIDYYGFEIPNKFVAGYGLDVKELFRNKEDVVEFDIECFNKIV